MALPKTIYVIEDGTGDDRRLLAAENIVEVSDDETRTVGLYKLAKKLRTKKAVQVYPAK